MLSSESDREEVFLELVAKQSEMFIGRLLFPSNHLFMSLAALYKLGGSAERMRAFFTNFGLTRATFVRKEAPPIECPDVQVTMDNWRSHLGDLQLLPQFIDFFVGILRKQVATEAVLRQWLPPLLPGVVAHAFHPLIRLGHALEIENDEEVALSLAYWAATYHHIPLVAGGEPREPLQTIQMLHGSEVLRHARPTGNINPRLAQVIEMAEFNSIYRPAKLGSPAEAIEKVSALAIRAFYSFNDFTLAHGVTGTVGLRSILPYLSDADKLLAVECYFKALCACYCNIGCPQLKADIREKPALTWAEICRATADRIDDDHVLKMVHACHLQAEEFPHDNDIYQLVAERALKEAKIPYLGNDHIYDHQKN